MNDKIQEKIFCYCNDERHFLRLSVAKADRDVLTMSISAVTFDPIFNRTSVDLNRDSALKLQGFLAKFLENTL